MDPLRAQYERLPYPPVPALALPRRGQGTELRFETGTALAFGAPRAHAGKRILVAGCGTLEALVVARMHPEAREVVAVDLSAASIAIARRRDRYARFRSWIPFGREPLAPVTFVRADLMEWRDGTFDLILASNVLHHAVDPAALLARLAAWLAEGGLLRVVTYPRASRLWMRETSAFLRANGLRPGQPRLPAQARALIAGLPPDSPIRACFESQPETGTAAGLTDAFLNARELPLSPLEWRQACADAGLTLAAEAQTETSRSAFLEELLPPTRTLDAWTKLEILDLLLELCANPVFWLRRSHESGSAARIAARECATPAASVPAARMAASECATPAAGVPAARMAASECAGALAPVYKILAANLRRADALLAPAGVTVRDAVKALREQVGPRVTAPPEGRVLPGLSILDYDLDALGALAADG